MRHIIVGGDGFVGRYLARDLLERGESVVVCDIRKSEIPIYDRAEFLSVDITDKNQVSQIPVSPDDIVYNVAARMLHPIIRRKDRYEYFFSVDFEGAKNVVEHLMRQGCDRLIQFSTDMVYGRLQAKPPIKTDHPRSPLGEYSDSKRHIEDYCIERRSDGLVVSIFRPRLIIGPSRLGILTKLFQLIKLGLPVPMIGNGSNHYQMVSVFDCASAAVCSAEKGVVNGEFNLGSEEPPRVRDLLHDLIDAAGSRSVLIPTPARLVKAVLRSLDWANMSLMVPEQYEVADLDYIIDVESTKQALDWQPRYNDQDMFRQAYDDFVHGRTSATAF